VAVHREEIWQRVQQWNTNDPAVNHVTE
jgi:hypothetical protein